MFMLLMGRYCLPYIMMPHIPRSAFHFVNCPPDSWYYFVKLHSFTIRQYRILPCRFLQCIPHGKPPCVVLILPISFRAYKGLAPSGKKTPAQSFVLTKNSCIFGFFSVALQQVRSAHAGHTHSVYDMILASPCGTRFASAVRKAHEPQTAPL